VINGNLAKETVLALSGPVIVTQPTGQRLSVPVELYIPIFYPQVPPICYVRPPQGFQLAKNHENLNSEGLLQIPLANTWDYLKTCTDYLDALVHCFHNRCPLTASESTISSPPQGNPKNQQQESPPSYNQSLQSGKRQQLEKKIQNQFDTFKSNISQLEATLFKDHELLNEKSTRISEYIQAYSTDCQTLTQATQEYTERIQGLQRWIDSEKRAQEFRTVDHMILGVGVSDQHANVVGEDAAIEDCMLVLRKAFERSTISFDVYMKQIRSLSRQQFFVRAMSNKLFSMQQTQS